MKAAKSPEPNLRKPLAQPKRSTKSTPDASTANPISLNLKHILAAVDFSECSRKALRYALALARHFRTDVTVVHVAPDVVPEAWVALPAPELQNTLLKESRQRLAEEVQRHSHALVRLKPLVRKGVPFHEIVQAAEELEADLIVVGTHGRTGLKHVLLGSTAERVVRHAQCPVLVVR